MEQSTVVCVDAVGCRLYGAVNCGLCGASDYRLCGAVTTGCGGNGL